MSLKARAGPWISMCSSSDGRCSLQGKLVTIPKLGYRLESRQP